jgi:hypothetical protein
VRALLHLRAQKGAEGICVDSASILFVERGAVEDRSRGAARSPPLKSNSREMHLKAEGKGASGTTRARAGHEHQFAFRLIFSVSGNKAHRASKLSGITPQDSVTLVRDFKPLILLEQFALIRTAFVSDVHRTVRRLRGIDLCKLLS